MKPKVLENKLMKLQRQISQIRKNVEVIEAILTDMCRDVNTEIVNIIEKKERLNK